MQPRSSYLAFLQILFVAEWLMLPDGRSESAWLPKVQARYIPQTPGKPFFFFLHTLRKIRRIEMVYSDNKATMIHQLALSGECTWQQTPKLKRRHRGNEVAHVC